MIRFILSIAICIFLSPSLFASDSNCNLENSENALQDSLDYCWQIYGRSRRDHDACRKGVAYTYENVLSREATGFADICHPFYLKACDSGRKIFLAKCQ